MDTRTHWEKTYTTKAPDQVSWYRPHLETSIDLIERSISDRSAPIIDIGGGESTLVDDLLARGFQNVTVLDVSQVAIDATKQRLQQVAGRVHWVAADVTRVQLHPAALTCGMTALFFISSPRQNNGPPTFGKSRVRLRRAAMSSLARSDQKAQP